MKPAFHPASSLEWNWGTSLEALTSSYGPPGQEFTIQPERAHRLVAQGGLEIHVPEYAFRSFDGTAASGPITFQLWEAYHVMDMLLLGKSTLVRQTMYEAAAMFFLEAYNAHGRLELAKPLDIGFPLKRELFNPAAMRLYTGSKPDTKPVSFQERLDWTEAPMKGRLRPAVQSGQRFLFGQAYQLGWMAALSSMKRIKKTSLLSLHTVSLWAPLEEKAAFLVLEDRQALVQMLDDGKKFSSFYVPSGERATAIVMAYSGEQFLWGAKPVSGVQNSDWFVELLPGSMAELKVNLERLCLQHPKTVWVR